MDIKALKAANAAQAEEILTLQQALTIRGQNAEIDKARIGQLEAALQKLGSGQTEAYIKRLEKALRITQLQVGGAHMETARVEAGGARPEADIRSAALEAPSSKIVPAFSLYTAVNKLVTHIGVHGEVESGHALVDEVMNELHQLDGGKIAKRIDDLVDLGHMPLWKASQLAVDEYCSAAPAVGVQGAAVPEARNLVERAARIAESYCACDDEEDGRAINSILRNRGAQIRSMLRADATAKPAEPNGAETALTQEVTRLQNALCFWLPSVTDREDEVACRILEDAFLLVGCDGNMPEDFKSAQELGWVALIDQRPHQAAPVVLTDEQMREAVAEGLRGLYGCGRVWSAWSVGTMREDDFYPAEESDECITQVVDAIGAAITVQISGQSGAADSAGKLATPSARAANAVAQTEEGIIGPLTNAEIFAAWSSVHDIYPGFAGPLVAINKFARAIAAIAVIQPAACGQKPIGYLPAYELGRLETGHDANLRSAKFGPSPLDGDVPLYASPTAVGAADQKGGTA